MSMAVRSKPLISNRLFSIHLAKSVSKTSISSSIVNVISSSGRRAAKYNFCILGSAPASFPTATDLPTINEYSSPWSSRTVISVPTPVLETSSVSEFGAITANSACSDVSVPIRSAILRPLNAVAARDICCSASAG